MVVILHIIIMIIAVLHCSRPRHSGVNTSMRLPVTRHSISAAGDTLSCNIGCVPSIHTFSHLKLLLADGLLMV